MGVAVGVAKESEEGMVVVGGVTGPDVGVVIDGVPGFVCVVKANTSASKI